jgi:stage V sporulation protein S
MDEEMADAGFQSVSLSSVTERRRKSMEVLKVSANSQPKAVAGAIAAVLREQGGVEVQAVGAGAVNQAVKSISIARGYVAPNGIDMICIPAFAKIEIDGEERTAIKFQVEPR